MPPLLRYTVQGKERTFPLDKDEVIVGRATECDVQLAENSVSRRHARVYRQPDGWRVVDLGSRNGTRVNDLPGTDKVLAAAADRGSSPGAVWDRRVQASDWLDCSAEMFRSSAVLPPLSRCSTLTIH
jgi:pSer/pThr/pTyr-binding forkhead associated (FHA) protein